MLPSLLARLMALPFPQPRENSERNSRQRGEKRRKNWKSCCHIVTKNNRDVNIGTRIQCSNTRKIFIKKSTQNSSVKYSYSNFRNSWHRCDIGTIWSFFKYIDDCTHTHTHTHTHTYIYADDLLGVPEKPSAHFTSARTYVGNVLASRSKVRGFKPGWGRWIFSRHNNSEYKSSGRDFKLGSRVWDFRLVNEP